VGDGGLPPCSAACSRARAPEGDAPETENERRLIMPLPEPLDR